MRPSQSWGGDFMSILSTSPTNTRLFDASIAAALGNVNAAIIVQQLNYWMNKDGVGTIINRTKYIYNTFVDWVNEQFPWLSVWQFRKAMSLLRSLGIVKVIRHKARQWNQTNFYSLDCDRLVEFLNVETSTSTEMKQLCVNSSQDDDNQTLEVSDSQLSYIDTKSTSKEEQQSSVAASLLKSNLEDGSNLEKVNERPAKVTSSTGKNKQQLKSSKPNIDEVKSFAKVEYIVNEKWKDQIKDLDSAGIPVNKTLIGLLKSYEFERVESAIALFKTRKREQHIPNPAGYFVKALKENWSNENASIGNSANIDQASVFRYWYDLARELGYCSGQEIRDNEQWVCLSGSWEKWSDAVERGYSVDYLKKIFKRNQKG